MTETIKTRAFDASEYFGDAEAQAELLTDALQTGDPRYIAHAIGVIAKARGMSELARETGLNRATLYAGFGEDGNPTLSTVTAVLKALKLELSAHPARDEAA